ncbi:U3 small nucleolar RNA-associated protein 8 [Metschnikowia aff. pulcherrima]|uniref:U3 small nucleolar RNA-associated protein 8 n=1 Tax=Metschnikowia aff. pulcherrima TaxID=2163413 RepID=A0A4P6XRU6_9ASCO|nr:U3 small nucleolar RNA-associated protein 8 [Metschnikowia aff. pulcherrima]
MAPTAPALGDTYTLMELPRTPDLALSQRVVVAEAQKEKRFSVTDTIDVGISKLIIASYVLKPTPKLVWSFPLSPNTIVDSLDVKSASTQVYAVGLTERNKSRLLLLHRNGSETTATAEMKLPKPAVAVKFSGKNSIYVLLQDGDFLLAEYENEGTEEFAVALAASQGNVPSLASKNTHVEYHTFIQKGLFNHKNDLLFYAVRSGTLKKVIFRLVALNSLQSFEIYQISADKNTPSLQNTCTHSQGVLYVFDKASQNITSRSLMTPQDTVRLVLVAGLMKSAAPSDLVMLVAVSADRLLLSHKSLVFLVNFKYESLLSEHTNKSGNDVFLSFALPVEGTSADSTSSFALYLNLEDKTKLCKLKLIQVEVGTNTMSESLGKAIKSRSNDKWRGVPHLADSNLEEANTKNLAELDAAYKKLAKLQGKKNSTEFDKSLIEFLKPTKKAKSPRFSSSSDRIVDHKFIELVIALVFSLDEEKNVQVVSEDFLPQTALSYLLTHPLFPVCYTRGLLVLLSALDQPELLKQAIQYCRALTLDELMTEFVNLTELSEELDAENTDEVAFVSEFLRITIDRILKDYLLAQITQKLQEVLTNEYETDNKKLERMLNVLINVNTNSSWAFVQAVIDVGGLFNWTVPTILALSDIIDAKVEALTQNSYNLTLTNQALVALEQKHQKKGKKPEPKVVDNIHEIANQRAQLDALLTISNNTSNQKLLMDEGIELAKQIPTYSRERLVI